MTDDTAEGPFPATVMVAVLWAFSGGEQFSDPAEFNRRVSEYHVAIGDEDTWDPYEVVLSVPRVRITWFGLESPEDEEYTDYVSDIESDNGVDFSAGELLLKVNNLVAPRLDGADHCYFEGLFLTDEVGDDGVPIYEMMQGS